MLCGLTASTSTSLRSTTGGFASKTSIPASVRQGVRAAASGSLARIVAGVGTPARSMPRIRAVAILPAPMKPQRGLPPRVSGSGSAGSVRIVLAMDDSTF